MLIVVWPLFIVALAPIILVESWVVRRAIGLPWRKCIWYMSKANIISTVIGLPLTWLVLVAAEFGLAYGFVELGGMESYPPSFLGEVGGIIFSAPWLGPFKGGGYWILPVAVIALLVPFYFVSAWAEALTVKPSFSTAEYPRMRAAVWRANLISYALLFVCCIGWLVYGLVVNARGA
jgi:hypothetical protein